MKINWGFGPPKDDGDAAGKKADTKARGAAGTTRGKGFGAGKGFGRRSAEDSGQEAEGDAENSSELHGWTSGASMATKGVVGLLWAALIAGPMALGLQLLVPPSTPVIQQNGDAERVGESAAVGEFAQRAVVAWLETSRQDADSLKDYFGELTATLPDLPWKTARPEVAEIVRDDNGLWSVVVGVDTTEGREEGRKGQPAEQAETGTDGTETAEGAADEPAGEDSGDGDGNEEVERTTAGRLYFRIPVLYVEGEMIAQALPAPVPAPAAVDQLKSAYSHALPTDHPAFARVANFLNAMLVSGDQAELEAYSSPGTSFNALDPVPYAAANVNAITATREVTSETPQDGETLEVSVDALLSGFNEAQISAQYALVLRARENRWEVAELRLSPALSEPVPIPTPTPTPTGTTTGTPTTDASTTPEPDNTSTETTTPTSTATDDPTNAENP